MSFTLWPRKTARKSSGSAATRPPRPRATSGSEQQRRRFVREMVRVPVTILDQRGMRVAHGATIEISEGGIRAHLNGTVLQENSAIRVVIALPGQGTVTIGAVVRRAPGPQRPTVIQFPGGHPHQDALRQLVFTEQTRRRGSRS